MANEMTYKGMTDERISKFYGPSVEVTEKDIALFHSNRFEQINETVQQFEKRVEVLKDEIKAFMTVKGAELLTLEQILQVMYKECGVSEDRMETQRGNLLEVESA
jgi:hypothetical protein